MAITFKIKLEGTSKPPVWRKVKVNNDLSFDELHLVIQVVFGWENAHMYQFSPSGHGSFPTIQFNYDDGEDFFEFSNKSTFPFGRYYDAEKISLKDYFGKAEKVIYIYDFGDDWKHSVVAEKMDDEKIIAPICLKGKGNTPPEDCGGIWGYYDMVDAVNDPKHPEYKEYREWLGMKRGEIWDLNTFDLDETNELLREVWAEYKRGID